MEEGGARGNGKKKKKKKKSKSPHSREARRKTTWEKTTCGILENSPLPSVHHYPHSHLLCTIDAKCANRFVRKSYPRDVGGRIAVAALFAALSIPTDVSATQSGVQTFAGVWEFRMRVLPAIER